MSLDDYFKNCRVRVRKQKFDIVKSRKAYDRAFANIDDDEITVIIEQGKYNAGDAIEVEKGWKILTFEAVLPMSLTGFLAKVSSELAEEKISIFAVSAYSTDHILVKEKDLEKARKRLEKIGCITYEK